MSVYSLAPPSSFRCRPGSRMGDGWASRCLCGCRPFQPSTSRQADFAPGRHSTRYDDASGLHRPGIVVATSHVLALLVLVARSCSASVRWSCILGGVRLCESVLNVSRSAGRGECGGFLCRPSSFIRMVVSRMELESRRGRVAIRLCLRTEGTSLSHRATALRVLTWKESLPSSYLRDSAINSCTTSQLLTRRLRFCKHANSTCSKRLPATDSKP